MVHKKNTHEIRDPLYMFIKLNSDERKVLDSAPLQRLRNVHQLSMSYLVYPGATHKRLEHSLGVMELATKIFDTVTYQENRYNDGPISSVPDDKIQYWRRVVRMAALCHDIGHLPFSHASEELFPDRYNHEVMTRDLIKSDFLEEIWDDMKVKSSDVAKIAVGPKEYSAGGRNEVFKPHERILSEIITSDTFGADRMDYLIRDSYHSGVFYGRFDHYRLIDTMRILPKIYEEPEEPDEPEFTLGIEEGGIQSAESLIFARYNMFSQLYFHPVRRIYDIHLGDYLKSWLGGGHFPVDPEEFLQISDVDILSSLNKDVNDETRGNLASIILRRNHFRVLYSESPVDRQRSNNAGSRIKDALTQQFGDENVKLDMANQRGELSDFPIVYNDDSILSSYSASNNLRDIPIINQCRVYVKREKYSQAFRYLRHEKERILSDDHGSLV